MEINFEKRPEMKVLPIECKAGVSGKMKSLRMFMRNKGIARGVRCSLENFALLQGDEDQEIRVVPLYAVSGI